MTIVPSSLDLEGIANMDGDIGFGLSPDVFLGSVT
jgi:hypothetical protein